MFAIAISQIDDRHKGKCPRHIPFDSIEELWLSLMDYLPERRHPSLNDVYKILCERRVYDLLEKEIAGVKCYF